MIFPSSGKNHSVQVQRKNKEPRGEGVGEDEKWRANFHCNYIMTPFLKLACDESTAEAEQRKSRESRGTAKKEQRKNRERQQRETSALCSTGDPGRPGALKVRSLQ